MDNPFRGFKAVFYKEVLHVRRDPGTLFFSLVIPLLQMFVLGFGIDTNVRQVHTVVYNADGRQESRELIDRLKNSDTFHVIRYVDNDRDLNDTIISGQARVGIKIPVDYSDRLIHQDVVAGAGVDRWIGFFRRRPGDQRDNRDWSGRIIAQSGERSQRGAGRGYAAQIALQS